VESQIEAIAVAPRARGFLSELSGRVRVPVTPTSAGTVHLLLDERRVTSIVTGEGMASPLAVVMPGAFAPARRITSALVSAEGILLGEALVTWTGAKPWDPRPAWPRNAVERAAAVARARRVFGANEMDRGSGLVNVAALEDVAWKLTAEALPVSRDWASALVGRGPGLTPAGDDALVGAQHALWLSFPEELAAARSRRITEAANGRTMSLAFLWLEAAANGEAIAPMHALVSALVSGTDLSASNALASVRSLGASSGRAMLAGFGAVLRCLELGAQPVG
jgi:hypothetical protein